MAISSLLTFELFLMLSSVASPDGLQEELYLYQHIENVSIVKRDAFVLYKAGSSNQYC